MINFQHLIQQWAAGLLQNTLYPIGSSLRNSDHQFSATTNVQNARGEFRKWELITATEQHICTRLCQGGVHGAATQTRLPFVLHIEGDTVSALRMAPSSATRSTRILSAVSRSWATQVVQRELFARARTMVGEPECCSCQCRNCKATTGIAFGHWELPLLRLGHDQALR